MFTEHKPYEPAFYATVNFDWGSSLLLAQSAGVNASCLVDLGHHLPNANIEQIVSRLAMVGRLGGFHFNDSKYGDDDLTTGSIRPFQLFLIFCELIAAGDGSLPPLAYMIDQSHNIKDPLEDLIQSTEAVCIAYAQALLVDRAGLAEAQEGNDAARAQELLQSAFRTDVRPLVAEARSRAGGAISPLDAYRESGYRLAMIEERGMRSVATGL
jgi:L-rhamnose isomerase/sugar isomerase